MREPGVRRNLPWPVVIAASVVAIVLLAVGLDRLALAVLLAYAVVNAATMTIVRRGRHKL